MKSLEYPQFDEILYTETLENGLKVNILPRKGFHKTYGIFTTNYGSVDSVFVPIGEDEMIHVPDGIAHFLEHKMFEKADHDAFDLFGEYGASANAFTSFTRTSYLFSSSNHIPENIETLLDFVQDPYFTPETVEKEKGIIGQEIQMYDDDPNWRLYFGILGNLYPNHPVSSDIAGTIESIDKITADDLYKCYETFYHPSNMNLFIVGNVDPEETLALIKANQGRKNFPEAAESIKRSIPETQVDGSDIMPYRATEMEIQRAKTIVGIKGLDDVPEGRDGLKYKETIHMLLYLLFGDTAPQYMKLYDEGTLDDSFGYEFEIERGFHFASISGDTDNPQKLSDAIIHILENAADYLADADAQFELAKREMLGQSIQSMNSLESIANQYDGDLFNDATVFDRAPIIENMTLDQVRQGAKDFIRSEAISVYQIMAKEDK